MKSMAQIIREEIEGMKKEAKFYRGIVSNVIKISMKRAICFDKPVVIEGEVEMEDIFAEEHLVVVRPVSETAVLIVPRYEDLIVSKEEHFDVYVYSNGVWLHDRVGNVFAEGCEFPLEVISELLGLKVDKAHEQENRTAAD
jgi:hypothetical protein